MPPPSMPPGSSVTSSRRDADSRAEAALFARHVTWLRVLLLRQTDDPELAADLAQEALRIALERLRAGEIREPDALPAFLRSTAQNLLIEERRRNVRRRTDVDGEAIAKLADEAGVGPYLHASGAQLADLVGRLIDEMTVPRDRELLWRHCVLDEEKAEVCRRLALEPAHFDRVLSRARSRLRELLVRSTGTARAE